jgi:FixJ family two-component response regulator
MKTLAEATLFILDNDPEVCESLTHLAQSAGWHSRTFLSADDFLNQFSDEGPGCIVLDLQLDKSDGLDVLRTLRQRNIATPVIIITGHATVSIAVLAFKDQVTELFEKPVSHEAIRVSIGQAIEKDKARRGCLGTATNLGLPDTARVRGV